MLDDKKLKIIEKEVPRLASEKEITTNEQNKKLFPFYSENALISLNTAKILDKISSNLPIKKQFDFIYDDFESYLWIVNTSYYSMFYMAGAMLAKSGIKIKSEIGIHKKTFQALVYYFYLTKKIAKNYLEEFEKAQEESQELLGADIDTMQKKAMELMIKYDYEMDKKSKIHI